jgi:hypothetical protein
VRICAPAESRAKAAIAVKVISFAARLLIGCTNWFILNEYPTSRLIHTRASRAPPVAARQ